MKLLATATAAGLVVSSGVAASPVIGSLKISQIMSIIGDDDFRYNVDVSLHEDGSVTGTVMESFTSNDYTYAVEGKPECISFREDGKVIVTGTFVKSTDEFDTVGDSLQLAGQDVDGVLYYSPLRSMGDENIGDCNDPDLLKRFFVPQNLVPNKDGTVVIQEPRARPRPSLRQRA